MTDENDNAKFIRQSLEFFGTFFWFPLIVFTIVILLMLTYICSELLFDVFMSFIVGPVTGMMIFKLIMTPMFVITLWIAIVGVFIEFVYDSYENSNKKIL